MSSRGQEYMEQAEKKLKRWFPWGSNKHEDAAELFEKAANQFKQAKDYKAAGAAFMRCADCHHHLGEPWEAAQNLVQAFQCYRKVKASEAVLCIETAINQYQDLGKFTDAARHQKELGLYYKELEDYEKAVAALKKAVDLYEGEEQHTSANGILLDVGKLYCEELGNYQEAVQILEKVAKSHLSHKTMTYQVRDIYLRAMLCRFATLHFDMVQENVAEFKEAFERYCEMDIHLPGTREAELIEGIIEGVEKEDGDLIKKAAREYNSIKPLDDWQVLVIDELRKKLETIESGFAP